MLWLELPRPGAGVCPGAMFPISIGAAPACVVSDERKDLIFQVVRFNFVYVDLCFHRSAVRLWDHSHISRFDDGARHRFLWRLSSKFSDQLPDHVQQVKRFCNLCGSFQFLELTGNGGCALPVPSVKPVGESVPSFSCCLGGVHNLASDTCCKSLHCKVDVFVKLGDLFSSQSIVLLSFGNELVLVPFLHLCRLISTWFQNLGQDVRPTTRPRLTTDGRTTCSSHCSRKCLA